MGCTKCNTTCDSNCNCVVRYTGPNIDCLGITSEDSFDTVLSKLSSYVCDINFEDGQSIDHTSFTSSTGGGAASQPGETDTYTVWGDPGETINLGTFTVYNGDEVNAANVYDAIYDSGWKELPDDTGVFGLPPIVGFSKPEIRVVDRNVFLRGSIVLPLEDDSVPGDLNTVHSSYPSSGKVLYQGSNGGYSASTTGVITAVKPLMPPDLSPGKPIRISEKQVVIRTILSTEERNEAGAGGAATITSVLKGLSIESDGKVRLTTQKDLDDSADSITGTVRTVLTSDLSYKQIHKFSLGDPILSFQNLDHSTSATNGYPTYTSIDTGNTYPFTFDGREPEDLGGFVGLTIDCSYPVAPSVTLTDIQNAIASW